MLADNDVHQLGERSEFLKKEGYDVFPAGGLTEARRLLEKGGIDLAIIDLRLERDSDERDMSGLMLAKSTDPNIPKIILTNFPTLDAVREALTASIDGLPPAIDFVDKAEGLEALLQAVRKALHVMNVWFRSTQDAITKQLHEDYVQARKEARTQYRVCLGISLVGAMIVILGAVLALRGDQQTGVASVVGGIITTAINLLFFARLDVAYRRVDKYHEELLQSKRLENLLSACGELSDPKNKEAAMTRVIETTTQGWMKAAGNVKSSSPVERRSRSKKTGDGSE
jgi:DNA-binding NarL/FixJ family response regulator